MPPKKLDEEFDEEDEEDEEEDEEDEEDREEMPAPKKNKKGQGRPKKALVRKPVPVQPAQSGPQARYTAFAQQAVEGIQDRETKEVIATDTWTALANIIERLERIENAIGVMQ